MPDIKPEHWPFYVIGREDAPSRTTVNIAEVVKTLVKDGGSLRRVLEERCMVAALGTNQRGGTARLRASFLEDHELTEATGEDAFQAWVQGRADGLALKLERDVVVTLDAEVGEDDLDDEDDDDRDEDDDEEDEDDD